ncbi:MAG: alpha/beta hydrolase [Oscillospiraceae bacterium]|nr:alpha/beta hydrolase [Oscillospiraceae bacterium]
MPNPEKTNAEKTDLPRMSEEQTRIIAAALGPTAFDPATVKNRFTDIKYGSLPKQLLDLYLPESGEKPYPVVIYVHGGGWSMGSKTMSYLDGVIGLLDYGYAVISVDYRLAPKTKFPEFLFDVKTSVRWARANAAEYGLDPDRFGIAGDSAGGHLALMVGFTADRPEYSGVEYGWPGYSDGVQAICDMYGPSILANPTEPYFRESGVPSMPNVATANGKSAFANAFGTDSLNLLKLISPISLVHGGIPPVLIMHGVLDGVVPYQHSTLLDKKIKEVCGDDRSELILYDDRNHADKAFNTKENSDLLAAFFNRCLR